MLSRALSFAEKEYSHSLVCCPPHDSAIPMLRSMNARILESSDINSELQSALQGLNPGIVFSVSNKYIIDDSLLNTGWRFFNIHNGLVQHYRGIAEICLLASLCRQSYEYGITLHEIHPCQPIDSGPVICQSKFAVDPDITLAQLISKTFSACLDIFTKNFSLIMSNQIRPYNVPVSPMVYNYSTIEALLDMAPASEISRITDLGAYQYHFPVLSNRINEWHKNRK